ncbi:MAG: hypothetical protein WC773_04345 [Patescibacteria group bacterium]
MYIKEQDRDARWRPGPKAELLLQLLHDVLEVAVVETSRYSVEFASDVHWIWAFMYNNISSVDHLDPNVAQAGLC